MRIALVASSDCSYKLATTIEQIFCFLLEKPSIRLDQGSVLNDDLKID